MWLKTPERRKRANNRHWLLMSHKVLFSFRRDCVIDCYSSVKSVLVFKRTSAYITVYKPHYLFILYILLVIEFSSAENSFEIMWN